MSSGPTHSGPTSPFAHHKENPMRHLLSLQDLDPATVRHLVDRSVKLADPDRRGLPLAGRVVGIYFGKSSTRTRTAFSAAALRLGASVIPYGPDDLQLTTGETWGDTARVMSGYLDAFVLRTNGPLEEMRELAGAARIPIVNALSEHEHPTQAIADLATLREHFGDLSGRHILYIGEGNSSAGALAMAVAAVPDLRLTLVTPEGYGLEPHIAETVKLLSGGSDRIREHHDLGSLPTGVDAVYATRWQTMGVSHGDDSWLRAFDGFRVTRQMMTAVGGPDTVFLHDLPAMRGQDVDDDVLDGPDSLAWRQAYHKMTSAMAVLEWAVLGGPTELTAPRA
ncbi:ornithine carbamoyltransferase [Streptomyces sp. NPDC002466]|uniref:ornithine carbamoyltransferase n=1 Tax=Streptomyces sp. NPDC002466 TaxID=3364646 RepID=UPI003680E33E